MPDAAALREPSSTTERCDPPNPMTSDYLLDMLFGVDRRRERERMRGVILSSTDATRINVRGNR